MTYIVPVLLQKNSLVDSKGTLISLKVGRGLGQVMVRNAVHLPYLLPSLSHLGSLESPEELLLPPPSARPLPLASVDAAGSKVSGGGRSSAFARISGRSGGIVVEPVVERR